MQDLGSFFCIFSYFFQHFRPLYIALRPQFLDACSEFLLVGEDFAPIERTAVLVRAYSIVVVENVASLANILHNVIILCHSDIPFNFHDAKVLLFCHIHNTLSKKK